MNFRNTTQRPDTNFTYVFIGSHFCLFLGYTVRFQQRSSRFDSYEWLCYLCPHDLIRIHFATANQAPLEQKSLKSRESLLSAVRLYLDRQGILFLGDSLIHMRSAAEESVTILKTPWGLGCSPRLLGCNSRHWLVRTGYKAH